MFRRRRHVNVEQAGSWACPDCGTDVPVTASARDDTIPRLDFSDVTAHALTHQLDADASPRP